MMTAQGAIADEMLLRQGGCRQKEIVLLFGLPEYCLGSSTTTTAQGTIADGTQKTPLHRMECSTVECVSQGDSVMEDHHCRQQQTEAPLSVRNKRAQLLHFRSF
jgi:hypothetical protein